MWTCKRWEALGPKRGQTRRTFSANSRGSSKRKNAVHSVLNFPTTMNGLSILIQIVRTVVVSATVRVIEQAWSFPGRAAPKAVPLQHLSPFSTTQRWRSKLLLRTQCRHRSLHQLFREKPNFHFSTPPRLRTRAYFRALFSSFFSVFMRLLILASQKNSHYLVHT